MTKQILAFLFCFTRELNPYSPLTLTLRENSKPSPSARTQTLYSPLKPGFIKPLVLTLTLRPPMNQDLSQKISFNRTN